MNKKVAILLATYNGGLYLEEQLQSFVSQTHNDWHLFVRDDGSTDNTSSILQAFHERFKNVTIVDNFGEYTGSAAGNFFKLIHYSDYSDFDFIAFADQDDVWAPCKVQAALQCMAVENADAYSSNLVAYDNSKRFSVYIDKSQPSKEFDYIFQGASAGCTYVFSQKVCSIVKQKTMCIESFKGRSHDWLIYAICRVNDIKWHFDECAYIFYRQHSSNVYGSMSAYAGLLRKIKLVRSGWYRDNVLWVASKSGSKVKASEVVSLIEKNTLASKLKLANKSSLFRRGKKESVLLKLIILFLFK